MLIRRERRPVVRRGFTLMEMLVVVAIIVVLAGTAIPLIINNLENAKKDTARTFCKATLTQAVEAYKLRINEYPPSLEALTQVWPDGSLPTLKPENIIDPWGHPYQYSPQGQHNAAYGLPDIWSLGPRVNDPNGIIGNW